jgi:hypothetical protein
MVGLAGKNVVALQGFLCQTIIPMKDTQAIIERVSRVNATHQHLYLAVDAALLSMKAGQSVLARVGDRWSPYLRQQWFPVNITKGALLVERPVSEVYTPGQVVSLLGIVGQPFRFRRSLRTVLLLAVETPPTPLLLTIPALIANSVGVTLVLLGKAGEYETAHLPPEVEIIRGDADLQWQNRLTTVGWADQVFAAVPPEQESVMMARVYALFKELRSDVQSAYLFGVFCPPLPCGTGGCGACLLRLKGESQLICSEGPAFDLTQVSGLA